MKCCHTRDELIKASDCVICLQAQLKTVEAGEEQAISAVKSANVRIDQLEAQLKTAVEALERLRDQRYAGLTTDFAAKTLITLKGKKT